MASIKATIRASLESGAASLESGVVTTVAWIQALAQELPHGTDVGKEARKEGRKGEGGRKEDRKGEMQPSVTSLLVSISPAINGLSVIYFTTAW